MRAIIWAGRNMGDANVPCHYCHINRYHHAKTTNGNYDLPCGHAWGVPPHLTEEELAVALLMMEAE